jgi:hypothetical protein
MDAGGIVDFYSSLCMGFFEGNNVGSYAHMFREPMRRYRDARAWLVFFSC